MAGGWQVGGLGKSVLASLGVREGPLVAVARPLGGQGSMHEREEGLGQAVGAGEEAVLLAEELAKGAGMAARQGREREVGSLCAVEAQEEGGWWEAARGLAGVGVVAQGPGATTPGAGPLWVEMQVWAREMPGMAGPMGERQSAAAQWSAASCLAEERAPGLPVQPRTDCPVPAVAQEARQAGTGPALALGRALTG